MKSPLLLLSASSASLCDRHRALPLGDAALVGNELTDSEQIAVDRGHTTVLVAWELWDFMGYKVSWNARPRGLVGVLLILCTREWWGDYMISRQKDRKDRKYYHKPERVTNLWGNNASNRDSTASLHWPHLLITFTIENLSLKPTMSFHLSIAVV